MIRKKKVNFRHTFTNKRVNATIDLVKEDSETGNSAQGDAVFEGAIYGLYAREDINHPMAGAESFIKRTNR